MAPRKKYSNACIAEAAAKAAADAKSKLPNAIAIQHLSCEHLVDASSADVKRNAPVKFRWRIQHGVYDAAAEVEALCHNVVSSCTPNRPETFSAHRPAGLMPAASKPSELFL